jgi:outer membrane protein OmpA-like peptidoglycan-associated protein
MLKKILFIALSLSFLFFFSCAKKEIKYVELENRTNANQAQLEEDKKNLQAQNNKLLSENNRLLNTIKGLKLELKQEKLTVQQKEKEVSELDRTRREIETSLKQQIAQKDIKIETANIREIQPSLEDIGINPADNLIIYFKPDSNDLTAKAFESLDRVVKFIAKNSKTRINIIGFSDSTGSSSYDHMVSESRANTVKSYIIAKGVDSIKISTLGLRSKGFSATKGTEEERQMIGGVVIEFNNPTTK